MISGEAGIGKSVLIDGLKATVRAEGLPRATMRCSPYHAGSALFPVIEHFRHQAGWQPGDDAQTRLAKLESMLGAYSIPIAETVPLTVRFSVPLVLQSCAVITTEPPFAVAVTVLAIVRLLLLSIVTLPAATVPVVVSDMLPSGKRTTAPGGKLGGVDTPGVESTSMEPSTANLLVHTTPGSVETRVSAAPLTTDLLKTWNRSPVAKAGP